MEVVRVIKVVSFLLLFCFPVDRFWMHPHFLKIKERKIDTHYFFHVAVITLSQFFH